MGAEGGGMRRTAKEIRHNLEVIEQEYCEGDSGTKQAALMALGMVSRTDLPLLLDAAVTEHTVLDTLVDEARRMSAIVSQGREPTRIEIMALDDALMGAALVLHETAWLEEEGDASSNGMAV